MAILYYPDHVQKKSRHVVEVQSRRDMSHSQEGSKDLNAGPLVYSFSPLSESWTVNMVTLDFSAAVSKTYSINVETGRGILAGLNDSLWIDVNNSGWAQKIILAPGFYDGTTLSAQVKSALEANPTFAGLGLTFTVSYNSTTDLFTITPSSGTIQYYNLFPAQNLRRHSTAGIVLGLTADQGGSSLVSDTMVPGLGDLTPLISNTGTDQHVAVTETIALTEDTAIALASTAAAAIVSYVVTYKTVEG